MVLETLWYYIQKGIFHILNLKDYTHILFLVVLTVPFLFNKLKRSLVLVTLIVIANILASLLRIYDIVRVDNGLLQLLTLLTIFILAVYNIFTSGKRAQTERYGLAFFSAIIFGIIHGLQFLRPFNAIHRNSDNKLLVLLEVSLGMEIGFIILAFISLFIGFICQTVFRFSRRDWVMVISAIIVGILLPMLVSNRYFT